MAEARWSTAEDVYDPVRVWQYRCLRASIGTTTGAIVMALLAQKPKRGFAFGKTCEISATGQVWSMTRVKDGVWKNVQIGTVEAVRDNLRRLADHCKLNDDDRAALFDALRKWVKRDLRANDLDFQQKMG